jgi:hypothetical protein
MSLSPSDLVSGDLLQCQKRPITVSKETYDSVKRDLLECQKRGRDMSLSPSDLVIGTGVIL